MNDAGPVVTASLPGGVAADVRQQAPARTDRIYDRIAQALSAARSRR